MGSEIEVKKVDFVGLSDFVELGQNYLKIQDDATDEILASIATKLRVLDTSINWYIGDFILEVGRVRNSDRVQAFLDTFNASERVAYSAHRVCSEFAPSERLPGLFFKHYESAMELLDEHAGMMAWLKRASDNEWTTGKMRQEIRKSQRPAIKDGQAGRASEFHAIQGSIKFARTHPIEKLSPEDREILKESAPAMVRWWSQIADA